MLGTTRIAMVLSHMLYVAERLTIDPEMEVDSEAETIWRRYHGSRVLNLTTICKILLQNLIQDGVLCR